MEGREREREGKGRGGKGRGGMGRGLIRASIRSPYLFCRSTPMTFEMSFDVIDYLLSSIIIPVTVTAAVHYTLVMRPYSAFQSIVLL